MKIFSQHQAALSYRSRPFLLPALCKMLIWLGAVALGGGLSGASTQAAPAARTASMQTAAEQIYLYDAQGHAVNATTTTYYQEPHVYGLNGSLIGTVGSNGVIYNSASQIIGYVIAQDSNILR